MTLPPALRRNAFFPQNKLFASISVLVVSSRLAVLCCARSTRVPSTYLAPNKFETENAEEELFTAIRSFKPELDAHLELKKRRVGNSIVADWTKSGCAVCRCHNCYLFEKPPRCGLSWMQVLLPSSFVRGSGKILISLRCCIWKLVASTCVHLNSFEGRWSILFCTKQHEKIINVYELLKTSDLITINLFGQILCLAL